MTQQLSVRLCRTIVVMRSSCGVHAVVGAYGRSFRSMCVSIMHMLGCEKHWRCVPMLGASRVPRPKRRMWRRGRHPPWREMLRLGRCPTFGPVPNTPFEEAIGAFATRLAPPCVNYAALTGLSPAATPSE